MIHQDLVKRNIPEILKLNSGKNVTSINDFNLRKEEMIEILKENVYGYSPAPPKEIRSKVISCDNEAFNGKAIHSVIELSFDTPKGKFSFPINLILPKDIDKPSLILHIAFRPDIPDRFYPVENVIDNGFATASFCYKHITDDSNEFETGLAGMYNTGQRSDTEWGKISMWAWAASRVMDYLQTLDFIDTNKIAVAGHSRLGKTALWCGAQDQRFYVVYSNNSGCSGDAITRDKQGENVSFITNRFGYWFCENYRKYADKEHEMPFDQHFLLASIVPRNIYVGTALEDQWADPVSEFLCCLAVNQSFELYGKKGLVTPDEYPKATTVLHDGDLGFHLRDGRHFFDPVDWQYFMDYLKLKFS